MDYNIVLIGFMGTGKTTVGRILSRKLKKRFIDTDKLIQYKHNMKIKDIFKKYGEDYFRRLEAETIRRVCNKRNSVISTGGGIILNPKNVELLKVRGKIFLLDASVETIIHNLKYSKNKRPLLLERDWEKRVEILLNQRESLYRNSADYKVNVDNIGLKEIVSQVIDIYKTL